jgi:hypothetical protein
MQFKQKLCNDGQLIVFNSVSCFPHDLHFSDIRSIKGRHNLEFDVEQDRLINGDK